MDARISSGLLHMPAQQLAILNVEVESLVGDFLEEPQMGFIVENILAGEAAVVGVRDHREHARLLVLGNLNLVAGHDCQKQRRILDTEVVGTCETLHGSSPNSAGGASPTIGEGYLPAWVVVDVE
ncbi:hypothetical protein [Stenotrophomonas maltophilia]|uniref:hypothetical protein n=1 Tax=Stenotrophomonas maltophilia TaxID=40324 RepID=UPI0021C620CD|nr:hypothetical protein [Stenotrophomonas maltophilia]MCU1136927.1 hypothetical protein [Stenotrophomonas maltophilia]